MIPVDSTRLTLIATGNCEPVMEWGEDASGKRTRLETQEVRDSDRLPLWEVEVLRKSVAFGRETTVITPVIVGSRTAPEPPEFQPVEFEDLVADFYPRKNGGMGERWTAKALSGDALDEVLKK